MNLVERTERILECMEQQYGHAWIAEPVQQANGSPKFIPLWSAYRERDAEELLYALDRLCTEYWTPMAKREAEASEEREANEERYLRRAAI